MRHVVKIPKDNLSEDVENIYKYEMFAKVIITLLKLV